MKMNKCPITYLPVDTGRYTLTGLHLLDKSLDQLHDFPFTKTEQLTEAVSRVGKMSIQGVQPKLSAVLDKKGKVFNIVTQGGQFIIKPQHGTYAQMPENEDLTMKMADQVGISTPTHGLIWCKDGSLSYFIKRFDRVGKKIKIATEDFAQLAGVNRDSKYNYSIEKVIKLIDEHCTFPSLEKLKFFKLILFCFLTGNEDMHLKNFSMITKNGKVELSPAYDLINSTLIMKQAEEEMALMLAGKRKEFRYRELIIYLGFEKLKLSVKLIEATLLNFEENMPACEAWIERSFLEATDKIAYQQMMRSRMERLKKG